MKPIAAQLDGQSLRVLVLFNCRSSRIVPFGAIAYFSGSFVAWAS
jgi:hypothetical protein